MEQLCGLDDISCRPMMGESIIYYRGKIVGGIYDNRLLVKKTKSALELMPAAICDFLQGVNIAAVFRIPGREGVPQQMRVQPGDAGFFFFGQKSD